MQIKHRVFRDSQISGVYLQTVIPVFIRFQAGARIDFRRQILTSEVDPRTERVK